MYIDPEETAVGYVELSRYPEFPCSSEPTRMDCVGYTYMSMVQLCNLSEKLGRTRGFAHRAFGVTKA